MNLQLQILQFVASVRPLMRSRTPLLADLRIDDCTATLAEIDGAIRELQEMGQLTAISNADAPGGQRYQATDAGLARLAQANLL